jgi:hypothetical protein
MKSAEAIRMPSDYDVPDVTRPFSTRLRLSSHAKLEQVAELWREMARQTGKSKAQVDAITVSHVHNVLIAAKLDEELAQWGGFAGTDEQKKAQLKALRESVASKK